MHFQSIMIVKKSFTIFLEIILVYNKVSIIFILIIIIKQVVLIKYSDYAILFMI